MTMRVELSQPASPQPGRLSRAITRLFMKRATVTEVVTVADGFRLITLESDAFRELDWLPGQKVQIAMGSAFMARTYTPIEWDVAAGRTRILGYAHGDAPGSAWLVDARPGDECDVFGPRASTDVGVTSGALVVFGDETSIGLVHAIARSRPGRPPQSLLEVNRVYASGSVVRYLDLDGVQLFERMDNEAQLVEVERQLRAFAAAGATFVLTGKASSVQRLRRSLKGWGVPSSRISAKAYWAPGKTGLD